MKNIIATLIAITTATGPGTGLSAEIMHLQATVAVRCGIVSSAPVVSDGGDPSAITIEVVAACNSEFYSLNVSNTDGDSFITGVNSSHGARPLSFEARTISVASDRPGVHKFIVTIDGDNLKFADMGVTLHLG